MNSNTGNQINMIASQTNILLKILFVCVGNSCRSPMAESVLRNMVDEKYWYIDSAAIADWNIGRSPEPRCIKVLGENGLTSNHITRQVYAVYIFSFYRSITYIYSSILLLCEL